MGNPFSQTVVTSDATFVPFSKEEVNHVARDVAGGLTSNLGYNEFQKWDLTNGIVGIVNRFYQQGKRLETIGPLKNDTVTILEDIEEIQNQLEIILGEPITISAALFGGINDATLALDVLQSVGYEALPDGSIESPYSAEVGQVFGPTIFVPPNTTRVVTLFKKVTNYSAGLSSDSTVTTEKQYYYDIDVDIDYTQIIYRTVAEPTKPRVWYVREDTTEYPYFNSSAFTTISDDDYIPIVPIVYREHSVGNYYDFGDNKHGITEQMYKDARRLLNTLGMNLEDVTNSIDENENRGKLADAFVLYAVDVNSTKPTQIEYMFRFFKSVFPSLNITKNTYLNSPVPVSNVLRFSNNGKYNYQLTTNYVDIQVKQGVIADIGEYTKEIEHVLPNTDSDDENVDNSYESEIKSNLYLRKQLTVDTYEEIHIHGLIGTSTVSKDGHTDRSEKSLQDVDEEDEDGLKDSGIYLPINVKLLRDMSLIDRRELLTLSGGIVYFALEAKKLKWYQTNFVSGLILVVALVLSIWSAGKSIAVYLKFFTVYVALALYLATVILIRVLVKVTVDLLVDLLGEENAGIFIVVLAVIAAVWGEDFTFLNQYVSADLLLQSTWALVDGIAEYYQDATEQIAKDIENIQSKYMDAMDEINEVLESFQSSDALLYGRQVQHIFIPEETPDIFFARTLKNNVGTLSLDMVGSYVSNALRLPTLTENILREEYANG